MENLALRSRDSCFQGLVSLLMAQFLMMLGYRYIVTIYDTGLSWVDVTAPKAVCIYQPLHEEFLLVGKYMVSTSEICDA